MSVPAEVIAHYNEGQEHTRLTSVHGRLEFWRTQDILLRHLPPAPARVLDVGGGSGIYAGWLAGLGYQVHVVDPVPLHVGQAAALPGVTAAVGDARALVEGEASYDAVLALGPLYHLIDRADRVQAWREFGRVVVSGGVIAGAAISRFAALNDGLRQDLIGDPSFLHVVDADLNDGRHRNELNVPGRFTTAYFHHPDELAGEVADAGLRLHCVLGVECTAWLVGTLPVLLDDPVRRGLLLGWLRRIEAEPTLLGASSHLLTMAHR
ncbi:MAG: class I SAM-dependent methyltransferase [Geodermatophilaceae bacterium]